MTPRMVQLLRWPLWSWRNLIVTVVAALLIFAVIGRLTSTTASAASPAASAGPVAAATPSAPPTTPYDVPTTSMASTPAPVVTVPPTAGGESAAAAVAFRFVTAWARPTVPAAAWAASLAPFCTPQLASALRTVDPGRVPASRVVGSARTAVSSDGAVVSVPTDGGSVELNLVAVEGGWKVSAIAPADVPPGAPTPLLSGATSNPDSSR